jgi:hypothetical protein
MPSEIVYAYEGHKYTAEGSALEGMARTESIPAIEREERVVESAGAAEARECRGVLRSAA